MSAREEILRHFEEWLDSTLAAEEPPAGIPAAILAGEEPAGSGTTDLYQMCAAITALTQEVKLQGRSFKQLSDTLARDTVARGREEAIGALLDVRERLLRGLESVRGAGERQPGLFDRLFARGRSERTKEIVNALRDGYRLGLEALDEALDRFDVRPIDCEGRPFDPRLMNAVDVEETDEAEDGTVLAVYRTGYQCKGDVCRPAKVRVARRQGSAVIR